MFEGEVASILYGEDNKIEEKRRKEKKREKKKKEKKREERRGEKKREKAGQGRAECKSGRL